MASDDSVPFFAYVIVPAAIGLAAVAAGSRKFAVTERQHRGAWATAAEREGGASAAEGAHAPVDVLFVAWACLVLAPPVDVLMFVPTLLIGGGRTRQGGSAFWDVAATIGALPGLLLARDARALDVTGPVAQLLALVAVPFTAFGLACVATGATPSLWWSFLAFGVANLVVAAAVWVATRRHRDRLRLVLTPAPRGSA